MKSFKKNIFEITIEDIDWDTSGYSDEDTGNIPTDNEMKITMNPEDFRFHIENNGNISDVISDMSGWLINGYKIKEIVEIDKYNDRYITSLETLEERWKREHRMKMSDMYSEMKELEDGDISLREYFIHKSGTYKCPHSPYYKYFNEKV